MKIRKTTFIRWIEPYTSSHSAIIPRTGIKTTTTRDGVLQPINLIRVEAGSKNGKHGELVVVLAHPEGDDLNSAEFQDLLQRFGTWQKLYSNCQLIKSGRATFVFSFDVLKESGMCETVMQMVSMLAQTLEVASTDWYTKAFRLEHITYVRVGKEWVKYEDYLFRKYPLHLTVRTP